MFLLKLIFPLVSSDSKQSIHKLYVPQFVNQVVLLFPLSHLLLQLFFFSSYSYQFPFFRNLFTSSRFFSYTYFHKNSFLPTLSLWIWGAAGLHVLLPVLFLVFCFIFTCESRQKVYFIPFTGIQHEQISDHKSATNHSNKWLKVKDVDLLSAPISPRARILIFVSFCLLVPQI